MFVWLISHQSAILFFRNKSTNSYTSEHYFSLKTYQHQPPAVSQTNRLLVWKLKGAGVPTRGKGTRPARFEACKPALGGGSHPALHPRLRQADTGARRRNKNTYRWVCSAGRRRDNHTSGKATPCRCRRRHRRNTRN